jgi:hypothetical protein
LDPKTGHFVKDPFSKEQLFGTAQDRFQGEAKLNLGKGVLFEAGGVYAFGPQGEFFDGSVRLGVKHEHLASVGGSADIDLTKGKFELSGDAVLKGGLELAGAKIEGDLGKLSATVGSRAEASIKASAKFGLGGNSYVNVDVGGGGKLEAIALQFSGKAESTEVNLGLFSVKATTTGDFNVGGIGVAIEGGVKTLQTKPGVRMYLGAGLTALIGGRAKLSVDVSLNMDTIKSTYGTAKSMFNGAASYARKLF